MIHSFFHEGWFFTKAVAAMHSFRSYMEQIIFDSSCLLRTATFLEDLSCTLNLLTEMRDFHRQILFRIPAEYLELLWLSSYKYFFVTVVFLISFFLKINTFSAQLLIRTRFFSGISNYSKYVLFRSDAYSEQLLFQEMILFRGRYFIKNVTFSVSSA